MNETLWLGRILGLGGVLESGVGLGLLLAPSAITTMLLRSPLAGAGVTVARLGGGGLLALGIACWSARETPTDPAGIGVAWGFLAYNIIACVILARARPALAQGGLPALGASILHGGLGIALLTILL